MTLPKDDLSLDLRKGLPDALRVLLADYPRDHWEGDPGFNGLVRFWLDRHMMFRRILEQLRAETERRHDGAVDPARYGAFLSRYGSTLVGELHGHHNIEDAHYFPVLARKDARLDAGFKLLDRDHHALDAHLNSFVERANAVLQAKGAARNQTGPFVEELARLEGFLDRHLIDEEELVVPVILRYGTAGLG